MLTLSHHGTFSSGAAKLAGMDVAPDPYEFSDDPEDSPSYNSGGALRIRDSNYMSTPQQVGNNNNGLDAMWQPISANRTSSAQPQVYFLFAFYLTLLFHGT